MSNKCIYCGEEIPEGRMVCWGCEHGIKEANDIAHGAHYANLSDIIREACNNTIDMARHASDQGHLMLSILYGVDEEGLNSIVNSLMEKYKEAEIRNA